MKFVFGKPSVPASGALVLFVTSGNKLLATGEKIDASSGGAITRALKSAGFKANRGDLLELFGLPKVVASRILLVGLGRAVELDALGSEKVGAAVAAKLMTSGEKAVHVAADDVPGLKLAAEDFAARLAYGAKLRAYRFDRYRTKEAADKKISLLKVTVATPVTAAKAQKAFDRLDVVADAVLYARDLVTEPGNVIHPESYAKEIKKLEKIGLKVEILGEREMAKLGMGALLGVGQGSIRESKLVVIHWNGLRSSKAQPVAFVGKGVTFDTGGISIKPAGGMEDMKFDMGGSAAVVGVMQALANRKAKVNAVGVVGLVENMPSHNAQRPGDVVTSMSGQTIEVINTDAEGRLVLADAVWYTQDRFKPKMIVNLATLTGAIIISLGHEYAGIFSNNDELARKIEDAGKAEGEGVWRFPLSAAYDRMIDSKIADMKNVGGREAGSITAAQFIQRFANDVPWCHMDIAGTVWTTKDGDLCPAGATGYGVRLLDRLVADNYEEK